MANLPAKSFPKSTRASKPKVRTGCITCKIRRVKCDELKPACLRCTSSGRTCDGYIQQPKPSAEPKQLKYATRVIAPAAVSLSSSSSIRIAPFMGSQPEQRTFSFFVWETIPQVCGIHQSPFWLQYVLQACHHNLAVRHAAIAVGALHEQFETTRMDVLPSIENPQPKDFALQQYNMAIRLLVEPIADSERKQRQNIDVTLIICILFICFEVLRGNLHLALAHVDAGVKVLLEMQNSGTPSSGRKINSRKRLSDIPVYPYAPISELSTLLARLDIEAAGWVTNRHPKLHLPTDEAEMVSSLPSSQSAKIFSSIGFLNLQSANSAQEKILSDWLRDFQLATKDRTEAPSKETLTYLKSEFSNRASQWNAAFGKLLAHSPEKTRISSSHVNDLKAIQIMQIQYTMMYMYLDIDHEIASVDETVWDKYLPQFRLMIDNILIFLNPTKSSNPPEKDKAQFSLEPGIIAPLMFIATRCRDPFIRRSALNLLLEWPRKEGVWDSYSAARRVKGWMETEENAIIANGDLDSLDQGRKIPAWARVCGYVVLAHEDKSLGEDMIMVEMFYIRPPPEGKENTLEGSILARKLACSNSPNTTNLGSVHKRPKGCSTTQALYWERYAEFLKRGS